MIDDDDEEEQEADDDDVNENMNPGESVGGNDKVMDHVNRRIILISDDAVEVKQNSPEKTKRQTPSKPVFNQTIKPATRNIIIDDDNNNTNGNNNQHKLRLVPPTTAFPRQSRFNKRLDSHNLNFDPPLVLPYNPSLSFDQNQHQEWEYVSASGESSVHAVNACAAWTTACGTLTSSLYNLRAISILHNKKNMNRSRQQQNSGNVFVDADTDTVSGPTGVIHDVRMKTDRIKTKFHLLQQNRLNKNKMMHEQYIESVPCNTVDTTSKVSNDIPSHPRCSEDYEISMLTLDEQIHQLPADRIVVPPSLSRHCNNDPLLPPDASSSNSNAVACPDTKEFIYPMKQISQQACTAVLSNDACTTTEYSDILQVQTAYAYTSKNSDKSFTLTPQTPRGGSTPQVAMKKPSSTAQPSVRLFDVALPYPLTQTKSSPTKLPSSSSSIGTIDAMPTSNPNQRAKDELPPPRPGATRRPSPMMVTDDDSSQRNKSK
jgi:hypothetical protein